MEKTIKKKIEEATVLKIDPDDALVWVLREYISDRDFEMIKKAMYEWCKINESVSRHVLIRDTSIMTLTGLIHSLDEGTKNKLRNELAKKDE